MIDLINIETWVCQDCTVGRLSYGNFKCLTLELPWANNSSGISCIVEGTYSAFKRNSPSNGHVLQLKDVPGRSYVQIHAGNYTRQIRGCILVGDSLKYLDSDDILDITNSKSTLKKLLQLVPDEVDVEITRAR